MTDGTPHDTTEVSSDEHTNDSDRIVGQTAPTESGCDCLRCTDWREEFGDE